MAFPHFLKIFVVLNILPNILRLQFNHAICVKQIFDESKTYECSSHHVSSKNNYLRTIKHNTLNMNNRQNREHRQGQRQRFHSHKPRYVDPPIEDITYTTIVNGTSNYVNTLFEGNNMEKIMREMIRESKRENDVGWLPSSRLDEEDIDKKNMQALSRITERYLLQDIKQQKPTYIANLAVSKTNGQNHYCAFWIDKNKRVVKIWDSATSAHRTSAFSILFTKAATLIFKDPRYSTRWADVISNVKSTTNYLSFQHGGGYLGTRKSLLAQNIFCHTWTLFFLELSLNKKTPTHIGCVRGTHPLLPLITIKLYAQCLFEKNVQTNV